MCGICGFYTTEDIKLDHLKMMNDTMYHRGPNDSGEEIYDVGNNYCLGLAQRRLSILDLSSSGHQPMHSENNRVRMVFNGEIYNFMELKKELYDYPFRSNSDTEVIIAAYLKWGLDFISKINGMFAIGLYDDDKKELYLIRDRVGKKPLYYWYQGNNIVFASELKPIMQLPSFMSARSINHNVIPKYLYHQYINSDDTIYENVYKLKPGELLTFKHGNLSKTIYWNLVQTYQDQKKGLVKDYNQAKNELTDILIKSVHDRMIADVPLGTFLSGGYDSSLITAMAQHNSSMPVKTYSIGFYENEYNEAHHAKEIAAYLGTDHTELYVTEDDMLKMVNSISKYYDEPFADSSQIPSMLVSQLASKDVTVVLSGDGGDELFCGYKIYDYVKRAEQLDVLGEIIGNIVDFPLLKKLAITEKLPFNVRAIVENRNKKTKTQFGVNNYINIIDEITIKKNEILYPIEGQICENNWQMRRMLLDMITYLPEDILCKVDRASMKYSIEARCPILDKDVIEYSFRLPHHFKYDKNQKKRILKDICYSYIPKELLDRPKKGFSVPIDKWLHNTLKEQVIEYSRKCYLSKQGIFNPEKMQTLVDNYMIHGDKGERTGQNYSRIIWSFFVFQQWYYTYYN